MNSFDKYIEEVRAALSSTDDFSVFGHREYDTPNLVWHFTSVDSFRLIAQNRNVRLGHIRFLNDSSEFNFGVDVLNSVIVDDFEGDVQSFRIFELLKAGFLSPEAVSPEIFLASFCSDETSLPHWQNYAANGTGVAIGFDAAALSQAPGYGLASVVYGKDACKQAIVAAIKSVSDIYFRALAELPRGEFDSFVINSSSLIDVICALTKSDQFRHEKEFRLIYVNYTKPPGVKFCERAGVIKPYIEFSFSNNVPIKKLVVGPGLYSELIIDSINYFLDVEKITNVDVSSYKTPYRF